MYEDVSSWLRKSWSLLISFKLWSMSNTMVFGNTRMLSESCILVGLMVLTMRVVGKGGLKYQGGGGT